MAFGRVRAVVVTAVVLVVTAVVTDRLALAIWRFRVLNFHDRLVQDAPKFYAAPERTVGWIPKNDADSWPRVVVSFLDVGVRPDGIIVDAEKGVQLIFIPPVLAWTTRLWPRLALGRAPIPPVMSHRYVITISPPVGHTPSIQLNKGIGG